MKQFKKNQEIKVYHDGKICRDIPATVLTVRSYGIKLSFKPEDDDLVVWFRRKSKAGKYEADGWNFWIVPKYS